MLRANTHNDAKFGRATTKKCELKIFAPQKSRPKFTKFGQ